MINQNFISNHYHTIKIIKRQEQSCYHRSELRDHHHGHGLECRHQQTSPCLATALVPGAKM